MSIVKMRKVAAIGLDEKKDAIMSRLMDLGVVELVDTKGKLSDQKWNSLVVSDDVQEGVSLLEHSMNQAEAALRVLERYDTGKEPLFKSHRAVDGEQVKAMAAAKEKAEKDIADVLGLEDKLKEHADRLNKLEQDEILLTPWKDYGAPLEFTGSLKTVLYTGTVPMGTDTAALVSSLEQEAQGAVTKVISSDKDLNYVATVCLKSSGEKAAEILRHSGFSEISFKGFSGTPEENLKRIAEERKEILSRMDDIRGELSKKAVLRHSIEDYYDMMSIDADREKVRAKLLKTRSAFYLEGWLPARYEGKAAQLLEDMDCFYAFRAPEPDEEVPVLLHNSSFFFPFEAITEMYSLPAYRGFDPTSIFALFYAVFFGMMLSDAGYGIVMAVACLIAMKKFTLEGTMYKMVRLFFYCGISTVFWGVMFGGWFGDFVQVFSRTVLGKEVTVDPLWFNPLDDPMKLLIFSLTLGVIHLFIGMGIKAYMQIKDGQWFDAVCDEGFWYLTILGLIALLGGGSISPALPAAGKWMAIVGAAGLLLTGGRHNKGFGKITGGLSNIYNITSYMSDILSYARLLALGLATGVIAQVVNTMGSLFGGGVTGLIILLVVFVFGHLLNFAINVLGAFIHASRLQYVEFFGKFYEDGGEPFDPFRKKTKYIRIRQEEE